jgi:predicted RNA-binding Zn-ribbon protein involved in translation (DUF1610 family)
MAVIGVVALMMCDSASSEARIRRCPNCGNRSLCKRKEKRRADDSNWVCTCCGNDADEFGNKL